MMGPIPGPSAGESHSFFNDNKFFQQCRPVVLWVRQAVECVHVQLLLTQSIYDAEKIYKVETNKFYLRTGMQGCKFFYRVNIVMNRNVTLSCNKFCYIFVNFMACQFPYLWRAGA